MKASNKLMILAVAGTLLYGAIFAGEKPATQPAQPSKPAAEQKPAEKKPAAKDTKTIRATQTKDGG